ncbi:MAG: hypothetical protein FK734_20845 [Asgard group archaeon]|nr:hypothetical protein [Asgard group archaeon]
MGKNNEESIDNKVNSWLKSARKGHKAIRKHLKKNTPLYTLFGIFNALMIYSTTIEHGSVKEFLVPGFFLLSVLVWIVIFVSALKDAHKSQFHKALYFLLAGILIGLIIFFVSEFKNLILSIIVFYIVILLPFYIIGRLVILVMRPFFKWIKSDNLREAIVIFPTIVIWIFGGIVLIFFLKTSDPWTYIMFHYILG